MEQSTSMLIGQPLKESKVTEEETEKEETEPPSKRRKCLPQVVFSNFSLFQFVFLNINIQYLALYFKIIIKWVWSVLLSLRDHTLISSARKLVNCAHLKI